MTIDRINLDQATLLALLELFEKDSKVKNGITALVNRMGIHAFSHGQRVYNGKIGGYKSLEKRVGIHNLSNIEKKISGRIGSLKSLESRGLTPYSLEKKETIYGFLTEKEYLIALRISGHFDGYGSWIYLTRELNNVFGRNRKSKSVALKYYSWKQGLRRPQKNYKK